MQRNLALAFLCAVLPLAGCGGGRAVPPVATPASAAAPPPSTVAPGSARRVRAIATAPVSFDPVPAVLSAQQEVLTAQQEVLSAQQEVLNAAQETVLCSPANDGGTRCVTTSTSIGALPASIRIDQVPGLHPAWLLDAYKLLDAARTTGDGTTIGIVIGGTVPNVESDLDVYRSMFGLGSCTAANGCLTVDTSIAPGGTRRGLAGPVLAYDDAWAIEATLDAEMASAICPRCNLVLIETPSTQAAGIMAAIGAAQRDGADIVSLSFAGVETTMTKDDVNAFHDPPVPVVAAAGDAGPQATWPASAPGVIAVGGTTLMPAPGTDRGWTETHWSGSGGGCSIFAPVPKWQNPSTTGCAKRLTPDVVAVADPRPGVAVYVSPQASAQGWRTFGGTSVATPIVAGALALSGQTKQMKDAGYLYANVGAFFPVPGINGVGSPNGRAVTASGPRAR